MASASAAGQRPEAEVAASGQARNGPRARIKQDKELFSTFLPEGPRGESSMLGLDTVRSAGKRSTEIS